MRLLNILWLSGTGSLMESGRDDGFKHEVAISFLRPLDFQS